MDGRPIGGRNNRSRGLVGLAIVVTLALTAAPSKGHMTPECLKALLDYVKAETALSLTASQYIAEEIVELPKEIRAKALAELMQHVSKTGDAIPEKAVVQIACSK